MEQSIVKQLEWLLERRKELERKELQQGGLTNINGSWVLRWREDGKDYNRTIPRNEYPIYARRVKNYRELKAVNRAIAQIEKALGSVIPGGEVAA